MKSTTLTVLSTLLIATSSMAEIVATGGGAVQIAPPPSVVLDALESDTEIRVFNEQQGVTLLAPLAVNITAPGLYDETGDLTPGVIPAGTAVDSHLVHYDIIFVDQALSQTGTVTFRDRILGVILNDADVDASDGLGALVTTYQPAGLQFRGAELDENDIIEVGCDFITLNLESFQTLDHIRVITARNQLCGEGCPSGFWKQCSGKKTAVVQRRIGQYLEAGFSPNGDVNAAFGTTNLPNVTLCQAENLSGGGVRRIARLGVAALLSASHPDIDYPLTPEEVIARVRSGNVDRLDELTPLPCPLP